MRRRPHRRIERLLWMAGASLTWERLWPRAWPVIGVAGVFVAVALMDLLPMLPGWLHSIALTLFAVAFAIAVRRGAKGFHTTKRGEARHRLERDSGLDHRPLAALEDQLATGTDDPAAQGLWLKHRERMAEAAKTLTVAPPAPGMARRDPWAVRVVVPLLLVIGLAAAGGDAGARLQRAFVPQFAAAPDTPLSVEVWITAPSYTRVAPMFLDGAEQIAAEEDKAEDVSILVPAGSTLLAQVAGVTSAPDLVVGDTVQPFEAIAKGEGATGFRAETTVSVGERLAISSGRRELVAWPIRVIVDSPPIATFSSAPTTAGRSFLQVGYAASDDYGVSGVTLVIQSPDGKLSPEGETEVRKPLPLSVLGATTVTGRAVDDLTAHAWAGQRVLMHLEAEDAAGQTGSSPVIDAVLPERRFLHPVAKQIIAQRKRLVDLTDQVIAEVSGGLFSIAAPPAHFANDFVVSLSLAVARSRIAYDRRPSVLASVRALLWNTALRIEEGAVPIAEQDLRNARQRLWEALRRDSDIEEIERLLDELQQALDRYLAAIMADLARKGEELTFVDPSAEMLSSEDFKQLIEMAREFARTGARDSARQMLSELQRLLDGLRSGFDTGPARKDLVEAHKLMNALRELSRRQQELLDQSFKRLREQRDGTDRNRGESPPPDNKDAVEKQDSVRRDLGDLMLRFDEFLGGIPDQLQKAERAMRGAGKALEGNQMGAAVARQSEAAELLQRAQEAATEQLAQRLGALAELFTGDPDDDGEDANDPFGRSPGGGFRGIGGERVKIPDQMEVQRAHRILRELRRRAGERHRPQKELDYIERLLKRF